MNKLLESVDSFGIPLTDGIGSVDHPRAMYDYILGTGTLVPISDPEVKRYKKELDKNLPNKSVEVFRAFRWHGGLNGEEDVFAKGFAMSFSENKATAIRIAKENLEDGLYEGEWYYVVSLVAPKSRIYFHYKYDKDLGSIYPKEKEVMVNAHGLPFKVVKKFGFNEKTGRIVSEDFKTSAKRFVDQGAEQAEVDQYFTQFKSLKQRIQEPDKKDIDRWSSWEEFKAFVDQLKGTKSKSQLKKVGQEHLGQDVPGAVLVAEDPYWWVYRIDTYEASRKIGSKTKWCIVAAENHWESYKSDGSKFFFYISKRLKPSVKWYKIAAQVKDGDIIYWDANDQSHEGGDRSIPFKIPAIPESELAKAEDDSKLITVYLNKDISHEDFEVLEQELHTQLDYLVGFELAVGSESINIHLNNSGVFKGKEHAAGELVYAIKATLKDMGYGVEEIAWSVPQRFF